ncbi:MAG: hypothetical protein K2N50_05920, partial [Clostridia bacterium]|nr:hypothetical protein [Clostridia bacterium]
IKIGSREQIFSAYSYSGDKLNSEFCDFIYEKAKRAPINGELSLKIYTDQPIEADEVGKTLKSHYSNEYREAKQDMKRVTTIAIFMAFFGVLTLGLFVLLNHFWDNFYISTIVEIAAWVFVWEAVDFFFLQRPQIKGKLLLIQRIYCAKTEVCAAVQ